MMTEKETKIIRKLARIVDEMLLVVTALRLLRDATETP